MIPEPSPEDLACDAELAWQQWADRRERETVWRRNPKGPPENLALDEFCFREGFKIGAATLGTEQTMHAAWRKRAEEAERERDALKAEVERLRGEFPRWDWHDAARAGKKAQFEAEYQCVPPPPAAKPQFVWPEPRMSEDGLLWIFNNGQRRVLQVGYSGAFRAYDGSGWLAESFPAREAAARALGFDCPDAGGEMV